MWAWHDDNAAEGGQLLVEIAEVGPGVRVRRPDERTRGTHLRCGDACIRQVEAGQLSALVAGTGARRGTGGLRGGLNSCENQSA